MNTFARAATRRSAAMRIDKKLTDMLPKGVLHYAMQIPRSRASAVAARRPRHPRRDPREMAFTAQFDARDTSARSRAPGIELPAAGELRREALGLLGAQPRPRPLQRPLVRGRRQRPHGDHHGASSGIGARRR
jgi:hypothetical protein